MILEKTYVSLKVFNILGVEIAELAGKEFNAGKHTVEFNPGNLSTGIYFYTIKTHNFSAFRKMLLLVNIRTSRFLILQTDALIT